MRRDVVDTEPIFRLVGNERRLTVYRTGRVMPYVRQTQRSRFVKPHHAAYCAWVNGLRDELIVAMQQKGLAPLGKVPIKAEIEIGLSHAVWRADLSNYVKSVEDAFNGALWVDDRWVTELVARKLQRPYEYLWARVVSIVESGGWLK